MLPQRSLIKINCLIDVQSFMTKKQQDSLGWLVEIYILAGMGFGLSPKVRPSKKLAVNKDSAQYFQMLNLKKPTSFWPVLETAYNYDQLEESSILNSRLD